MYSKEQDAHPTPKLAEFMQSKHSNKLHYEHRHPHPKYYKIFAHISKFNKKIL